MSSGAFGALGGILKGAGALSGNPLLSLAGSGIGLASSFGGSGGRGASGAVRFRTPSLRVKNTSSPGRPGVGDFERNPLAELHGGISPQLLISEQNRFREGFRGLAGDFRSLRSRLDPLRGRAQALVPGFRDIRGRSGTLQEGMRDLISGSARLREEVRPGFGRLTDAAVKTIRNRRDEAVGNLRESLARRRVLGSSFAEDAQARVEAEFADLEERTRAQAIIEEIGLSRDLMATEAGLNQVAAQLLQLDAATLAAEGEAIAMELGLNQQDAQLVRDELVALQTDAEFFQSVLQRERDELALTANIVSGIDAVQSRNSQFSAALALQQASAIGGAAADFGASLGRLFSPGVTSGPALQLAGFGP